MKKFFTIGFVVFLGLIIYWANTASMPALVKQIYRFPFGDKLGHFTLYATLAYLLSLAMPFKKVTIFGKPIALGVLLALGFATLEEFSQFFFPSRTPDLFDLASGYLGIFASTLIPCIRNACPPPSDIGDQT